MGSQSLGKAIPSGLRIGKDLPALKRKLRDVGFKEVKAYRAWVPAGDLRNLWDPVTQVPVGSLEDFLQLGGEFYAARGSWKLFWR